jgi:DnaJ-class molecular chaperone
VWADCLGGGRLASRRAYTASCCCAAYRKKALEHHPDKALAGLEDEGKREKVQEHFLLIQEAYEHLSEPAKRREYDSVDEFDDSLPESCAPEDFYRVRAAANLGFVEVDSCLR